MSFRPSRSPAHIALLLGGLFFMAGLSMARTPSEPSPHEAAAECVAVLKRELKPRLHTQPTAQENDDWKRQAESAFAHAGGAYNAGVSEVQAQQMLDSAEERVAHWPDSKITRHATTCQQEGQRLLQQAAPLEKMIVKNAARRWLTRQLRKLES
jgi:hypothetical protein